MIEWTSEGEKLPIIGQTVLLATPRQLGDFWDIDVVSLLVRFEGVTPLPVPAGSGRWPTEYYWGNARAQRSTKLITGNGWWSALDKIPLPPMAEHGSERGYHFIRQIGQAFVPKTSSQ